MYAYIGVVAQVVEGKLEAVDSIIQLPDKFSFMAEPTIYQC
jgi:hypothetical protein